MTVKDIVSSIFKRYEKKWLSPVEIRDISNYISEKLGMQRPGDPGRTARDFAQEGFVEKDANGNCLYDSSKLSPEQNSIFLSFEYAYNKFSEDDDNYILEIPISSNTKVNESELGTILKNFKEKFGTYGVHYFALKYAKVLQNENINKKSIIQFANIGNSDSWNVELLKGIGIYNLAVRDGYLKLQTPFNNKNDFLNSNCEISPFSPTQTIFYGVPGSGKSHKIDEETKDLPDEQKMRVVFHPEYTNADFVGQILPVQTPGGIDYLFKAGSFSRILKRALKNPDKPYYLIIEEINRGNAAAIFGDLFQLLDRNSDGWSSYSIENMDINAFIRSSDDKYSDKNAPSSVPIGNITFTENTSIRLPPNLSLFATMNTSDQNVFTLDNAFQRRWDMKLVENKFEGEDAENQRNAKIGGTDVTWEIFQTHINKKISEISSSAGMSSMEDKRLGCWFVKETDGKISKEKFAEKVLKYLWDDAFKFNHDDIFNIQENASFESIVEKFKGKENESCDWSIFKDASFVQSANEQ